MNAALLRAGFTGQFDGVSRHPRDGMHQAHFCAPAHHLQQPPEGLYARRHAWQTQHIRRHRIHEHQPDQSPRPLKRKQPHHKPAHGMTHQQDGTGLAQCLKQRLKIIVDGAAIPGLRARIGVAKACPIIGQAATPAGCQQRLYHRPVGRRAIGAMFADDQGTARHGPGARYPQMAPTDSDSFALIAGCGHGSGQT